MKNAILILLVLAGASLPAMAQATTVFSGIPVAKISEGGTERLSENLSRNQAVNVECVISQIGDEYYWASRKNTRLIPIESGAFITFVAMNGSGYVRIIRPGNKEAVSLLGGSGAKFDYVEHLLTMLNSVTYYGTRTSP